MLDFLHIAKWEFVPSIANGIVSASSILMAVAIFSINTFHITTDGSAQAQIMRKRMFYYIIFLFTLLMGEVFFGYLMVSLNLLPFALCIFMSAFFLQCGVIFNLWVDCRL